jgi:hypothetical protein
MITRTWIALVLVVSTGAGSEMRRAMGVAVFSGMLGVTFFGLLFTPLFYVLIRGIAARSSEPRVAPDIPQLQPTAWRPLAGLQGEGNFDA